MTAGSDADNWFQDDQPRRGWAYFEDSDTWRPTPWHWGAPADHFPAEQGDWVAVTKPGDWRPPGMAMEVEQEDPTPGWGSGGKLAGADSEAGRKEPPAEPWSILTAGTGHLEHIDNNFGGAVETIVNGIGEAVSKGATGAAQALGKTWDALTTNKDLHKGVEFGAKAAWEVSKDVGKTVLKDTVYNSWDTLATEGAERFGLKRAADVFGNPAITLPLNKAWGMKRTVEDVWGGGQERDTTDLGRRIDSAYEDVYGRKR